VAHLLELDRIQAHLVDCYYNIDGQIPSKGSVAE
jgi:hypothetical protein